MGLVPTHWPFPVLPLRSYPPQWLSSLGAWVLVYKVVRKLEFYRNADFHDRCKNLRRQKKRVRCTRRGVGFTKVGIWANATHVPRHPASRTLMCVCVVNASF